MNEPLLTREMHVAYLQSEMERALSLRRHHREHRQPVRMMKIQRQDNARLGNG